MKIGKILMVTLLLGTVVAGIAGCKKTVSTTTPTQTMTVTRGDITLDITAAGNLALSTTKDLTFDLFYAKGTVGEVMVSEGDTVTEGQVLASLDTSEWNEQIQTLEDAVTTARRTATTKERALATAQRAVTTKKQAISTAEAQVTTKELALRQAQIDLETAQYNLESIAAVKEQQDIIDFNSYLLQFIETKLLESLSPGANPLDYQFWVAEKARVTTEIEDAQDELSDILSGTSLNISTTVAIEVTKKQLAVETAQFNLETATKAIDDVDTAVTDAEQDLVYAQLDVEDTQTDLDDANRKVADAQKALDDARAASPQIMAPFDGFVTSVNVAGGDEVLKGAVIVQVADPNKFEAEILVSEMDILNVTLGDTGTIIADAIPDVNFPVEVTHISPTATISSSVVNYAVTVEVTSLIPVATTTTLQVPSGNLTLPEGFELPEDFTLPENFTPPTDTQNQTGQGNFSRRGIISTDIATSANTTATDKEYTLKAGMTVTVTLTLPLSTDVLLVPSSAILTQGNLSYVVVMLDDGTTENRIITTGSTDYTNTEVTSGLAEGEKILVAPTTIKATATATTTNTNRPGGGMFFDVKPGN